MTTDAEAAGRAPIVAMAGNPNTGKSTLFNAITGLRQHTGNWPGKTVARAEGHFQRHGTPYRLIDLPGTYSLLTATVDEEIARDFILFGRPACTVIVVDATSLERNLNLVLQVLEITNKAVVALNLVDEAERKGLAIDHHALSDELGIPVVPTVGKTRQGVEDLLSAVEGVVRGEIETRPRRIQIGPELGHMVEELAGLLLRALPQLPNARWVAMRLLEGDRRVQEALQRGELGAAGGGEHRSADSLHGGTILDAAVMLRRRLDVSFRDAVVQAIYADAERITRRVMRRGRAMRRDWDTLVDRLLTSPWIGLPIMGLGLAIVFWITIVGANVPSEWLASVLFSVEDQGSALFDSWNSRGGQRDSSGTGSFEAWPG